MRSSEGTWLGFGTVDHPPDDARFRRSAPVHDALRVLGDSEIHEAIASLSHTALKRCLRTRLLPLPDRTYAACGRFALRNANRNGVMVTALVRPRQFLDGVREVRGLELRDESTQQLQNVSPHFSAHRPFSVGQMVTAVLTIMTIVGAVFWGQAEHIATFAMLALSLIFLAVVAVRILVLLPHDNRDGISKVALHERALPVYSVLVPLFKETQVLDRLLASLGDLDYPTELLDIKIIVEEFDSATRRELATFVLPSHFEIIVVPAGHPQTKPRALNYGLMFARGELLTIYDAEDLPSPRQLRKCASVFAVAPANLACLQARLRIFNANESWLTRQFALEYASLFGEILPGLASLHLPLPLGGTSNHFRVGCLRQAGGWDPYNVTEDADLGIRLARMGFRASTIASDTLEEACVSLRDWNRQRARWLKGFLQTWLVHMRTPRQTLRQLGGLGFLVFQAVTLGVVVSALLHPAMMTYAVWHIYKISGQPQNLLEPSTWLDGYGLMVLVAGYGASIWTAVRTIRRQALPAFCGTILTLPVYWLLLTPAAWLALWQFATDLHGWNKTPHGKSRLLDESQ